MHRVFVFLVLIISLNSCNEIEAEYGDGNLTEKPIDVQKYDRVRVSGNFDILLRQDSTSGLTITTDENLFEFIEVKQDKNRLIISSTRDLRSDHGIKITLSYVDINELIIGGTSTIHNEGILKGDRFTLDMSGAGAVKMEIDMKRVNMKISGAGSVELAGKADTQEISMSGAGGLDAENLISRNTEINISGVGGAHVYATERLDASVSGVGGVIYSGEPKKVKRDVSGLGSINKR